MISANKLTDYKLIVTVVKKGHASRIVKASKRAGAEGGTILYGRGIGIHEDARFFGISIEPEKEIILTVITVHLYEQVLAEIVKAGKLDRPGTGIAFVFNLTELIGIAHHAHQLQAAVPSIAQRPGSGTMSKKSGNKEKSMAELKYDMIMTIVNKGNSELVVEATKRAGAEGGTILHGRGTGIHEHAKLFSIQIEPEKEIVLTLIDRTMTDEVIRAIEEDTQINKPGKGIAVVMPVERTAGIHHRAGMKQQPTGEEEA